MLEIVADKLYSSQHWAQVGSTGRLKVSIDSCSITHHFSFRLRQKMPHFLTHPLLDRIFITAKPFCSCTASLTFGGSSWKMVGHLVVCRSISPSVPPLLSSLPFGQSGPCIDCRSIRGEVVCGPYITRGPDISLWLPPHRSHTTLITLFPKTKGMPATEHQTFRYHDAVIGFLSSLFQFWSYHITR